MNGNGFVIMRGDQYVARSGSASSYTRKIQEARVFATREQAERERCGDEHIVPMAEALR